MGVKNIYNQIKYYMNKYGFKKTISKCVNVVKNREFKKKEVAYGTFIDWVPFNELDKKKVDEQRKVKFKIEPKISIVVPMYNTPKKFFEELVNCCIRQSYTNWELCLADGSPE